MDINPLVGVGAIGRLFGDLKERAFKGDGVILSDGALLLKHRAFSIWVEWAFLQAGSDWAGGLENLRLCSGR